MKIGYARVSSYGQNLDIQLKSLQEAGCEKIYSEKVSAAKVHRIEYEAMLDFAREGDQVVVTKLDRLSRSLFELQKCALSLENKKIDLMILDQSIDTSTPTGRLLFNVIGTVAEFEREMINQRAAEGRKAAREKGVVFGCKRKLNKDDIERMANLIAMGAPKSEVMELFKISKTSVLRYLKQSGYGTDGVPLKHDIRHTLVSKLDERGIDGESSKDGES